MNFGKLFLRLTIVIVAGMLILYIVQTALANPETDQLTLVAIAAFLALTAAVWVLIRRINK